MAIGDSKLYVCAYKSVMRCNGGGGEILDLLTDENHLILGVHIPYSRNLSLDKNSPTPATLALSEIFAGINFHQCSNDCHIFYVIINMGQNIRWITTSPMQAGGNEIDENFLLANISGHTVYMYLV